MASHKWIKLGGNWWRCEKCNIEKTKVAKDMGGWEYYNYETRKEIYHLPECAGVVKNSSGQTIQRNAN